MARNRREPEEEFDDAEFEEPEPEEYADEGAEGGDEGAEAALERPQWLQDMPFFALSALLHLILFIVLYNFVVETRQKTQEESTIQVRQAPPPPPKYDPTLKRAMKRTPKLLHEKNVKQPIVKLKKDTVTPDIPKGTSLDNLTNLNILNSIHDAIGVGGGAAGAYGERWGKGSLWNEGGSEGTEEAVRAALEWLRRHQAPNGSWESADFVKRCRKTCQNENPARYGDGRGFPAHDVGVTGLAILAFAGYGHTHRDGVFPEYVECLRKAVDYLLSVQVKSNDPTTNGRFGDEEDEQWIYDHAIATMGMAELLVMSNDVIKLKRPVTDAVRLCLRAQNDGYGWRYGVKPGSNDTSVTGWMVLALKTAKNARVEIPKADFDRAFAGALNWFNQATNAAGKTGYMAPGDEGSRLLKGHPDPYPYSKDLSCMTAVGVLCRIFSGESRSSPTVRNGVKILMAHTPKWQEQKGRTLSTINLYYWYYGSYALFQFGGPEWKKWNEDMQEALLNSQRAGEHLCEDGSWDPIGEWGIAGGRVYSTAIGAMTLEVYYRFRRIQGGVEF